MKTPAPTAKLPSRALRFQGACLPALLMLAALSPSAVHAQQWTWNGGTGSWSTNLNWTPETVPLSDPTTQLTFEASSGYTTTNDIGAFTLNRLTVNNTGTGTVTIKGATTADTFTFAGVDPTINTTGTTLFTGLMLGSATITKIGAGTFIHDSNNTGFTGTIIINEGTFINRATTVATTNFNPVSIVVNNGGTYQFGVNGAGNPNIPNTTYITVNTGGIVNWQEPEDFGGLHLQGGTITLQTGNINANGTTPQSWTSGTLTGATFGINGSNVINKTSAGTLFVTGNASINVTGGLNILEGTVSLENAANLGTANVRLGDGAGTTSGTINYLGETATRPGNFDVDAGGGTINISSATTVLTLGGGVSGLGNLTKTGPGRLSLTGSLNGTGTISASAGTLQVEPVAALSKFAVAAGATFAVNSGPGTSSFSAPGLSVGGSTSTLQLDLNSNAVPAVPLAVITESGGFTFSGTPTLRLTNQQSFANGTYTLIDYNGTPISTGFNLALPGRTIGTLGYDTANTKIDVTISGTDTVKWSGGVNGDWDLGTAAGVGGTNNWKLVTAGSATNFIDTDTVTFDDTATRFAVNLATTVKPFSVAVNANGNYTIAGSGKISGTTGVTKSGTGTLILATDNDYSGGTVVNQGILQLGNGGAAGSVVGPITVSAGALAFNRSDDYTFENSVTLSNGVSILQNGAGTITASNPLATGSNTIDFGGAGNLVLSANLSGNGVLNKNGTGTLTLLANNNQFTGTLNVNGGTVLLDDLGAGGDLGATSIVLNNGGTFVLGPNGNADLPDATVFTINTGGLFRIEQGENYGGVILNGGELRMVSTGKTGVNSTGIATVDGATVYDLRSGTIATDITGGNGGALNRGSNGFGVLTKTTAGTVTVTGTVTFQPVLPLNIKEGTLSMGFGNFPAAGAGMITLGDVATNGTIQINGPGTVSSTRSITLAQGGGTFNIVGEGDTIARVGISGSVTGTGSLTKSGAGILMLDGSNDYTGDTTVSAGTLEVNNFVGSGTGSGAVTVTGTLAGEGSIATAAGKNVSINGKLEPGFLFAQQGVDFNISTGVGGSTVFGASSIAAFDLWSSTGTDQSANVAAADRLVIGGNLSITDGAVLKLNNPASLTFQLGDVFRVVDWTSVGTVAGAWTIDSSALNLGTLKLDTSKLYVDGTVAVSTVPEPSSAMLALAGFAPLALRRRRRAATK